MNFGGIGFGMCKLTGLGENAMKDPLDPEHQISCGHGFKRELPAYRGIRIFEMSCGEVRASLSTLDYFQPEYIREWIDAAFQGEVDGWHEIDVEALQKLKPGWRIKPTDKRTLN